jgi:hypothetical protein
LGTDSALTLVWYVVGRSLSRRAARALQDEIDTLQNDRDDD